MSPWSLAIGNLARVPAPPPAAEVMRPRRERKATPEAEQKPGVCPHCGQPTKPEPKRRTWTRKEDERLKALLAKGDTYKAIAIALDRPLSSIGSRIATLRLPMRRGSRGVACG